MRHNTQNPIGPDGSIDPRDLVDNAGIIDLLMNGPLGDYLSRLGVPLKSWVGIMQQVTDYLLVMGFEAQNLIYGAGVIVDRQTQLIERDGELYKVRLAADLPLTLTGDWATDSPKLQAVGDAALRQALAADDGADLVGGVLKKGEVLELKPGSSISRGVSFAAYFDAPFNGAVRMGACDLTDENDEKGYWVGLPSRDAWGDPRNIGFASFAANRNGASYKIYSSTFGHDCVTYGTASFAAGAGSCTGNPYLPDTEPYGYCSFALGKNVWTPGEKACGIGDAHIVNVIGGFATGRGVTMQPSTASPNPVGSVGMGNAIEVNGLGHAMGSWLECVEGVLIGRGINEELRLRSNTGNEIGFGIGRLTPTLRLTEPVGADRSYPSRVGINNEHPLNHEIDIDQGSGQAFSICINEQVFATETTGRIKLQALKTVAGENAGEMPICDIEWTSGHNELPIGSLKFRLGGRTTVAFTLLPDGTPVFGELKDAAGISGAPAGSVYKDGGFLKVV